MQLTPLKSFLLLLGKLDLDREGNVNERILNYQIEQFTRHVEEFGKILRPPSENK